MKNQLSPFFCKIGASILRRGQFLVYSLVATGRSKTISNFLPIAKRAFDHPWIVGFELKIRFFPGNEKDPYRFKQHWDAPIGVTVFKKRSGKKRPFQVPAFYMSFYLIGGVVHIRQLQGVSGTDLPKDLRAWPEIFVKACKDFVRQERQNGVWIPRAESLHGYHAPWTWPYLSPTEREVAESRIRFSMRARYDQTARNLGFEIDGDWYKWQNPR
jgi:hypothetical protein